MTRTNTREEIVKVGGDLMVRGGYGQTGIDAVLKTAGVPKGSFYYYFSSKEDFGLAVIDHFADQMLERLRLHLADPAVPPLRRLRNYLEGAVAAVGGGECRKGCLFGDLGQEMAHQNDKFRERLQQVFDRWKELLTGCLQEARRAGTLSQKSDPGELADFILSGWEGAILRAKVARSVAPMTQFIDVLFDRVLDSK